MTESFRSMFQRALSFARRMLLGSAEYRSPAALRQHMDLFERVVARNPNQVDFDGILKRSRRIGLLVTRSGATSFWQNLPPLFPDTELVFLDEPEWPNADVYFVVGIGHTAPKALERIYAMQAPCYVIEETFLKSVAPGAMSVGKNIPASYFRSVAYVMDAKCPAFYSGIPSQLELDINSDTQVTTAEKTRARRLIDGIVANHISKYNCHPVRTPQFAMPGARTVLVIDQAYRDFSVALSGVDDSVFDEMLRCAIEENPGARIVVRQHVDKVSRETYFSRAPLPPGVIVSSEPCDAISVLMAADCVYTFSSTMGWEALMCGKEVQTFGAPIYAGWGLTRDRRQFGARRTKVRSVEELFHFIYIRAARFIDPERNMPCSIERAVEYLVAGREQFLREVAI